MNTFTHLYEFYNGDLMYSIEEKSLPDYVTGIEVTMDRNDFILYWNGVGDYIHEVDSISTYEKLQQFILDHVEDIEEDCQGKYTRMELIQELLEFINESIEKEEKGYKWS